MCTRLMMVMMVMTVMTDDDATIYVTPKHAGLIKKVAVTLLIN